MPVILSEARFHRAQSKDAEGFRPDITFAPFLTISRKPAAFTIPQLCRNL
jgi:hypothetical protein